LTAGVIRTVVAVTADGWVVLLEPLEDVSAEVTSTQSPTLTSASFALTCLVKVVLPSQVTATCPFCWLCTCAVDPSTAATFPLAPGIEPPDPFVCPFGCPFCSPV
jgi:hypothetical protein